MSMDAPILLLDKVRKAYRRGLLPRHETFSLTADLAFPHSRIVGVIGPNGAGKTTLFELITGNNTPSEGRVMVAGRNMRDVKLDQVRRFVSLRPSFLLRSARSQTPIVHLFDEPQFNTQDGYIGFMLAFFRKLRAEGKLVFMSLHPTASYHLEILREIAEEFLVVGGGRVERRSDFNNLAADPAVQTYLGPDLAARARALA
jgi:ABC-type thiamine transport system ATPase subunit